MDIAREFQDNVFIGHNLIGFDLKIIKQRAMILGIKPPSNIPFNAKPWDSSPFDTMLQWDARNFVKLDKIAKAFGLQGKNGEGCKVYEWWQAGKFDKIADYCASDVELTYQVYKRMTWQTS
jgi:DNA polymerase elongation subunit (family B)